MQFGLGERLSAVCYAARVEYLDEGAGAVRLEKLDISGGPPPGVSLTTSVTAPLGEFVVVGRVTTKGPQEAVVAVLKAELVK